MSDQKELKVIADINDLTPQVLSELCDGRGYDEEEVG